MRTTLVIAAAALAALLPFGLARAGGDARVEAAAAPAPAHQLLGDWNAGRDVRVRVGLRRGVVQGRAVRAGTIRGCRVRRGSLLLRELTFVRHADGVDRWEGVASLPGADCRRRSRPVAVTQGSDLRVAIERPEARTLRMRRVRPRARATDPVLAAWERNGAGVVVERTRRGYVGRAREAFLIANGCTIPAGTVVWRLRPAAPQRYDGITRTFAPPPGCGAVGSAASRWRLADGGRRLLRESADGTTVTYDRAR